MRDLVVIGCGGFGREVADLVDDINREVPTWRLIGFTDDGPSDEDVARVARTGRRLIGSLPEVIAEFRDPPGYVIGIGDGSVRAHLATAADSAGWQAVALRHPSSHVGSDTSVGEGSVLCAGSVVTTNVRIGRHVHVDRLSTVGHDCWIDDFATVHPAAVLSGNCRVGRAARIGTHATLLPGVHIGEYALVGGAACVTSDVHGGSTVKGVPAR